MLITGKRSRKGQKMAKKKNKEQIVIINNMPDPHVQDENQLRTISLYGDISERKASEVVAGLLFLENTSHIEMPQENEEGKPIIMARPISMIVSTHGGVASEMFSILDSMDMIKDRTCDIETIGLGKVMSAGVPILAAGTKGKRSIGRNCRIMLHNVLAGTGGTIFSMENELEEIKWTQERYIKCLASYTKLTPSKIKKLLKAQKDVYISPDEAIKMGIVDQII